MTTVTGKVVKIQLTIEYTKEGEYAPFHTKTVTIPRDEATSIGALILSMKTHDEIAEKVHSSNVKSGMEKEHQWPKDENKGLDGSEVSNNTLAIVYKDQNVEESVLAACGGPDHPKTWDTQ